MAFDFPASPTDGTVFSPAGGPTYIYSGGVWKISGGGGAFVVVADAAPVSPYPGMLWFESDTGALFFWYVDADSSQWVQINFTPSGARTAETRNRLVNPAFQITQENGANPGTVNGYYMADQWVMFKVHSAGTMTAQRYSLATWPPGGSTSAGRITITAADTALAAGEYLNFSQPLENARCIDFMWGYPEARQVVVRFGFRGPAGTYSMAITCANESRAYVAPFTITAGQANQFTLQTFVVPGDTTGTTVWGGGGLPNLWGYFYVTLAAGTTLAGSSGWQTGPKYGVTGMTNGMGTAGSTFDLFEVGLYLDPLNTGVAPPWQMPDEAQELAACMRYWQRLYAALRGSVPPGGTYLETSIRHLVSMRTAPAVSLGSGLTYANCNPAAYSVSADGSRLSLQVVAASADTYASTSNFTVNSRM